MELVHPFDRLDVRLVDASIVTVAGRLRIVTLATLNHRDFAVVRPGHCDAFELIP